MIVAEEPMTKLDCNPEPVGPAEIAERLGVAVATVYVWRHHGLLPAPRWQILRGPVWDWRDIAAWAASAGRLRQVDQPPPSPQCSSDNLPDLVSSEDIARRLGISAGAVRARARRGQIPAPRWHIANRAVWDSRDIDRWIAAGGPQAFSTGSSR